MSALDMVLAALIVSIFIFVGALVWTTVRHDGWMERCAQQGGVPVGTLKHSACVRREAVITVG